LAVLIAEVLVTAAETDARERTSRGDALFSGAGEQRAAGLLDNASKNIQESGIRVGKSIRFSSM
jgi:hypothetical protein